MCVWLFLHTSFGHFLHTSSGHVSVCEEGSVQVARELPQPYQRWVSDHVTLQLVMWHCSWSCDTAADHGHYSWSYVALLLIMCHILQLTIAGPKTIVSHESWHHQTLHSAPWWRKSRNRPIPILHHINRVLNLCCYVQCMCSKLDIRNPILRCVSRLK